MVVLSWLSLRGRIPVLDLLTSLELFDLLSPSV